LGEQNIILTTDDLGGKSGEAVVAGTTTNLESEAVVGVFGSRGG
jgi:hypothetical protein